MKFKYQILLIGVIGALGALVIGLSSWHMSNVYDNALKTASINADALRNHVEGDMMHDALRSDVLYAFFLADQGKKEQYNEVETDFADHSNTFLEKIAANKTLDLNPDAKRALASVEKPLKEYIAAAEQHIKGAIEDVEAEKKNYPEFDEAFGLLEEKMETVSDALQASADVDVQSIQSDITIAKWTQWLAVIISTVASFFVALRMSSRTLNQLGGEPNTAVAIAQKISSGNFSANQSVEGYTPESLLGQLELMREALEKSASQARTNKRIRIALDAASTNVMIVNADSKIIYLNRSLLALLQVTEYEFKKLQPSYAVENLLNNDLNHLPIQFNNVELQTHSETLNCEIGSRIFRLYINPIMGEDNARLGTVIEWLDRTQEINAEKEVSELVEKAAKGDFSERINTQNKQGFFLKVADDLNKLVTTSETGLGDVARVLGAIAKGDLTEKIEDNYQGMFGDLKVFCNTTTNNLTEMLSDVRAASDTIFQASNEIAAGNADLSARTEQQASSLEETASSMQQITSTVKLNAENARQANALAEKASTVASDGGALIQQVVSTMNDINKSSQKIADIIGVIDGIAFQTNILALNAAVEAARAGDQGRGFAVVASEVRTLAQRSANAAKDIKSLISDSVHKIESGNALVSKSGDTMKEIVVAIKRVNDIMAEIAAASVEQSIGIDGISASVTQMDEMTQKNSALVEHASATAENMKLQADQLIGSIEKFRLA
jgi:methyl-accepting chemotaxis protein